MKRTVAYYPGCSLEGLAEEYDRSTRAVCRALGLELVEIPDWNCCGSTPAHGYTPLLSAALAGRNLALAEDAGLDVVMTPCPGCLKALKGSLEKYREDPACFQDALGRSFDGRVRVVSILQLLLERIGPEALAQAVRHPLTGANVVPYYGCLLTRPASFAQFDDPENPVSMDRILEAIGCTVPDFPFKTECCGATYGVTRNPIVTGLTGRILDMAVRVGAAAVAVACPLCQQNLDLRQQQVEKANHRSFRLPVLYITQLVGLALGLAPEDLGLDKLFVSPESLLSRIDQASDTADSLSNAG
ncbi:heterodisulfide reductase subunit B [Desulfacinum hydrothermale DSM 13146]|uniref:Heterodisulfide reductase subunit B n=1 Tax=Desulfacinum hydrothermale DSM 13146 TaxID=1121390 RepID=A0A1W1X0B2_9BACT|nr:CoB--CoM heterodisulfide reductase iron-sulfur subunit B family protein [Desulfacinum hydrothermale]SMC17327.1 heterodisulfide reductase subunit B [Desulfacinum hydrothermale DSM 13146]